MDIFDLFKQNNGNIHSAKRHSCVSEGNQNLTEMKDTKELI